MSVIRHTGTVTLIPHGMSVRQYMDELWIAEEMAAAAERERRDRAWIARELGDVVPEPCTIQFHGVTIECERRMPVWPEPEAATVGETAIDWDAAAREQPAHDTGD